MESDELDFSDLKEQVEQILELYKEQTIELQKQAGIIHAQLSGSSLPNSTEGIKKETAAKKEALVIDGQLTQKKKDQIAAQTVLNQLSAVERANLKDANALKSAATDSYTAMQIEVKKLTQEWKNADAALRAQLTPQIDALNAKLKAADATIGVHNRNVGNYTKSIRGLAMEVGGLTGIMNIFGKIVGIDTEQLQALHEIHSTLREGSRDLSHLSHEHTEAIAEEKVATTELAEAQEASLGPLGLILIAVGALIAGIAAYIAVTDHAKEVEKAHSVAMDGTIITDKKLRDEYNETIITLGKLGDEYLVLIGKLDKFQAKQNEITRKLKKDRQDLRNEEIEAMNNTSFLANLAAAYGFEGPKQKERAKIRLEFLQKDTDAVKVSNAEIQNNQEETRKDDIDRERKYQEQLAELRAGLMRDGEQKALRELEIKRKYERLKVLEDKDEAEHIKEFDEATGLMELNIREEWRKKEMEKLKEYWKGVLEVYKKQLEEKKKLLESSTIELNDLEEKLALSGADIGIGKNKSQTQADKFILEKLQNNGGIINSKNIKSQQNQLDKIALDEKVTVQSEADKKLSELQLNLSKEEAKINNEKWISENDRLKAIAVAYQTEKNEEVLLAQDTADKIKSIDHKLAKDKMELTKKLREVQIKQEQQTLQALGQVMDSESKLRQDSLKTQTDMIQNEAQIQATLAASGRKNTLAQTMAAENKAAEDALKLQRQQQRQKEAIALAELFISAEEAYIKGGATPVAAAAQAMGSVLLAKGIAAGLAGAFFEGTHDTGGPGQLDNKGGMLAILHPHEAVIPKIRNEEFPGLAKAWINGDLESYITKLSIPVSQPYNDDIKKELTEIKDVLKNQKWGVAYPTKNGAIIEEHTGDGKKTRIIEEPLTVRII